MEIPCEEARDDQGKVDCEEICDAVTAGAVAETCDIPEGCGSETGGNSFVRVTCSGVQRECL